MSFFEALTTKLSHNFPNDTCCRLAFLSGVVKIDGSIHLAKNSQISLELKISNMALARRVMSELKSLFALEGEMNLRRTRLNNAIQGQLIIKSDSKLTAALETLEVIKDTSVNFGLPKNLLKRSCCKRQFLRGAFFAGGYISQSSGEAQLEISSENEQLIEELKNMINEKKFIKSSVRVKDNYYYFYLKGHKNTANFLKLIEATEEAQDFENALIIRNLRNVANRLVNAETANKNRVIKNAFRQIKEINLIESALGLYNLSANLQEICKARLENPTSSFAEIGKIFNPPLSKSAVNHRFRRLRTLAEKLANSTKK